MIDPKGRAVMRPARFGAGGTRSRVWLVIACLGFLVLSTACGKSREGGNRASSESRCEDSVHLADDSCTTPGAPTAPAESSAVKTGPGLVFGYGARLEEPYVFTRGDDGRTLYLNGLIYDGPGDAPPPQIEVTEVARSRHELAVKAHEHSRRGRTYDERKAIYADVLRRSELVQAVREFPQGVYVRWRESPEHEEEVIIPREESQFDLEEFQQGLISQFRKTVNSGGMIAFGKGYHIYVPPGRVQGTLEQLERIRAGGPRDTIDVVGTPLQNEKFLSDLYEVCQDSPQ
jgi:hypothetical protein